MAFAVWGLLSTRVLAAIPSALPRAINPDSPHTYIVHSALLLPESRVNGCKWNFVCWPFKKLSTSLANSPSWTKTLQLFTTRCYLSSFPSSGATGWGPPWGLDPILVSGNSLAAEISLWNFSYCLWELSQPSQASSSLSTSLLVVFWFLLYVLGYKTSLQLVFSWLFGVIFL